MAKLTAEQKHATNVEVDMKQREVRIIWADGFKSGYPFDYLRKNCPCAVCNEQRKDDDPLRILKPDQAMASGDLTPSNPVEMVGNYALQFNWIDGHRTGIYTFGYLRQLSPQQS